MLQIFNTILSVIIILFVVYILFISDKVNISKNANRPTENKKFKEISTLKEVYEDLLYYISIECDNTFEKVIYPLINKDITGGTRLINDDMLNSMAAEISNDIIMSLSDDYRYKVSTVINNDSIDGFILKLVYDTLSSLVIKINSNTIKKF